ncbi:MAG TPA: nucleotide sugar dehydrogenase [Proteobacteria bacterium]|nr:nucleotide sugar dehydrogenase [Pseudomonadota bacterium]
MKNKKDIKKISVFGPGVVGMPMAAGLAESCLKGEFAPGAFVQVIQRDSRRSGWKVPEINSGKSPIGGIEPGLEEAIARSVTGGTLKASHDYLEAIDSDLIIVAVQTDKKGLGPDYGPLMNVMEQVAEVVGKSATTPVVISESTLAPSTINTVLRPFFQEKGLKEGRDLFLGISPNRVMPGLLMDRVRHSDKLIGCLNEEAGFLVRDIYQTMSSGDLHTVNSFTAECVKTAENCYRDVMIAFAAELARYCDRKNYNFLELRKQLNDSIGHADAVGEQRNAVPQGAILLPTTGVGGHCLPKDGILLSWRYTESSGKKAGIILKSREINDQSPQYLYDMAAAKSGGRISGKAAVLGASYLFNSDDTRNSPSLALAAILRENGLEFLVHDPYVRPEDFYLELLGLTDYLTDNLEETLRGAEVVFIGTGHGIYYDIADQLPDCVQLVVDGTHIIDRGDWDYSRHKLVGIGHGTGKVPDDFVQFAHQAYDFVQWGFAQELKDICEFYDRTYLKDEPNYGRLDYRKVRELVNTCPAGRFVADADAIPAGIPQHPDSGEFELLKIAADYHSAQM